MMCLAYIRYRLASTAATTEEDEEENQEKEEREWQKAKELGRCKVEMREKGDTGKLRQRRPLTAHFDWL